MSHSMAFALLRSLFPRVAVPLLILSGSPSAGSVLD
jgi:hypothetical protein